MTTPATTPAVSEKCEECGANATHVVHDKREVNLDTVQRRKKRWDHVGTHYFCADHARPQRLTFSNGRVFEGMDRAEHLEGEGAPKS